jgi:hypothetical protein
MAEPKDKYNFVLYVPEMKYDAFRVTDEGRVVLELPVNRAKKVLGKLVAKQPVSDLGFDELSSAAWLAIDGKRSILDIARMQGERTGDDVDEAARRIVQFMRYIAKRGWIRFKEVQKT